MRRSSAGAGVMLAIAALLGGASCPGQAASPVPGDVSIRPESKPASVADKAENTSGETVDRIIAIVNGDLVLESDVDEERRFAAFEPFTTPASSFTRDQMVQRLINRTLILQQAKLQASGAVTSVDVTKQIDLLRKEIPACKRYACGTDAGWAKFLADQGFTAQELQQRWKERMEVLQYIENRFRMGIRISPEEIKTYYDKNLLPEYSKERAVAPKLADISDRVQEILLQQQVSHLLQDWLTSLRAQGTLQIMKPGEVAP